MTDEAVDAVPPSDDDLPPDLEIAIVGACFLDAAAADLAFTRLRPQDFQGEHARTLFVAAQRSTPEGGAADPVAVREDLYGNGAPTNGFMDFIKVALRWPTAANQDLYVRLLLERESRAQERIVRERLGRSESAAYQDQLLAELATIQEKRASHKRTASDPLAGVRDLADIHAAPDPPKAEEFVFRVFARPSLNLVFGPPSAGKSWAIMALLVDASTRCGGDGFLGFENLPIEWKAGDAALWVYGAEDHDARVDRRLRTILGNLPDAPGRGRFHAVPIPASMLLHTPEGLAWLESVIVATKATLVALDTIASLTAGALDINKAEQVAPFMANLLSLRARHHLVLFALTHTRKASQDLKKGLVSHADSMLGSQTWRSLADGCLMLDAQDGNTSDVKIRLVKGKDIDSPIPTLRACLVPGTGRFRPLEDDEAPVERAEVAARGHRQSECTVERVMALRPKHPDGIPWSDMRRLLGVPDGTWKNNSVKLKTACCAAGCVMIDGSLRWPSA